MFSTFSEVVSVELKYFDWRVVGWISDQYAWW